MQPVEQLPAIGRAAECQHGAAVAIPRPYEGLANPLTAALRRHHRVVAPRAFDFNSFHRHAHGQRRVMTDDRRSLARDPDFRLAGLVVRIAAVLPVPAEPDGAGRIGAVRAAVQAIDAATIVRLEAIDFGHGT